MMITNKFNLKFLSFFFGFLMLVPSSVSAKKPKKPNGSHAIILTCPEEYWKSFAQMALKYAKKIQTQDIVFAYPFIEPPTLPPAKKYRKYFKFYYKKGKKAYKKGHYRYAIKRLKKAAAQFELMGVKAGWPYKLRRFTTLSYMYLGAAQMMEAKIEEAAASFRHARAIYPAYPIPKKIASNPNILNFINKSVKYSGGGSGSIIVNSPKGFIFLDGNLIEVGPVTVRGVEPGTHSVTWVRTGYIPQIRQVKVQAGGRGVVNFAPEKVSDFNELKYMLNSINTYLKKNNKNDVSQVIINISKLLRIKNLVIFRASPDDTEISIFNRDMLEWTKRVRRRNAVIGTLESSILKYVFTPKPVIDVEDISSQGKCFADSDCENGGSCLAGRCVSNAPVYKKWWFWTAIGAGLFTLGGGTYLLMQMQNRPYFTITSP